MTYIKTYVAEYNELLKLNAEEIVFRYRKYECLIGDERSIDYINRVLKEHYEKNQINS
tara:strand:+ start:1335 stop:1508 length:174 start_codon:yes stop_codon:yes gene_type:complete